MIPECTTKTSILYANLTERAKKGLVVSLKPVWTPEGSYVVAFLKKAPDRAIYVTTRRDRTRPRTYIDYTKLVAHIKEDFADVPVTPEQVWGSSVQEEEETLAMAQRANKHRLLNHPKV